MFSVFALLVIHPFQSNVSPYSSTGKAEVEILEAGTSVPVYETCDLRLKVSGTYSNPFDPREVTVDAVVTPPSGASYTQPGFFSQRYQRELIDGTERLKPQGEPEWRIRITPRVEGAHKLEVKLRDKTGSASKALEITATKPSTEGFVRISPRDRRYFEFYSGKAYWPLGANVCWAGPRGTFDYDDWFGSYGSNGANYARLWLSPDWSTFALERNGKPQEAKGMGHFDLANAWRIDYVLEKARVNGMYLMLCIDSYNILRNSDGFPWWERTPHNRDNGGPLRIWSDFWTSAEMERLYRAKLRYLVARYGADPHVFAWEFWNEVDLTRDFDAATVASWHQRMADYLRETDPYNHLVTTSMANTAGDRTIDLLPSLDFIQTHHYGSEDLAATVAQQQSRKGGWGKPHFFGEIGADASGPRRQDDPRGVQLHDPLWMSIATGSSGSAMSWWWDNLIAPENLYGLYGIAAKFVNGIDWPGERFRQTAVTSAFQAKPAVVPKKDLVLSNGPVSWQTHPSNQPAKVQITAAGAKGSLPLAGIQHGIRNHPRLHNPVLFEVNLPHKTRFEVEVGDVSGYGGAALRIKLDGERVMDRQFRDPDDNEKTETLTQYAGSYGLDIPAGRHTVTVENVGNDWFMASYRFVGLLPRTGPPIEAWSVVGNTTALAWVRPEGRTWKAVAVQKRNIAAPPPTVIGISGLAAGPWKAEVWDTWNGNVVATRNLVVTNDGKARIPLPSFQRDVAVKMTKAPR